MARCRQCLHTQSYGHGLLPTSGCSLDDEQACVLAKALTTNTFLETLELAGEFSWQQQNAGKLHIRVHYSMQEIMPATEAVLTISQLLTCCWHLQTTQSLAMARITSSRLCSSRTRCSRCWTCVVSHYAAPYS